MIEVTGSKALVPENDLQELWRVYGTYEAIKNYVETAQYPGIDDIRAMMGLKENEKEEE